MAQPLEGVRVIDMSHVIAGPLASLYLAQLGAEVLKIESPYGGDVMRSSKSGKSDASPAGDTSTGFAALNAGKRSLAIDIRTKDGADAVRELARTADVFIENFRPGVVAKYGLAYDAIRQIQPDIVYCSISGFGQQGDWAHRAAYDHVIQALTGMMMMSGDDHDGPPLKVGFPVVDVAVGMLGALSIVAAVHRRARDGTGQYIDASMVEAALMLMYPNSSSFLTERVEPQRVGNRGYTGSPTADTYRCLDGWIAVAANTPAQFRLLASVLGLEYLCIDADALDLAAFNAPGGGFVVARDLVRVQRIFSDAFRDRSAADMETRLSAVGVAAARVRRLGEFLDEAESGGQFGFTPTVYGTGNAVVRTPGLGFRFRYEPSGAKNCDRRGAPGLGQDNIQFLSDRVPPG